jgi:hypothetical protein
MLYILSWIILTAASLALLGIAGAIAACMLSSKISRQEEATAMQTEAVAATRTHPVGCCCNECEDRMAQTYDGYGRPYRQPVQDDDIPLVDPDAPGLDDLFAFGEAVAKRKPVHLETLLDNSCGEICRLPEQRTCDNCKSGGIPAVEAPDECWECVMAKVRYGTLPRWQPKGRAV